MPSQPARRNTQRKRCGGRLERAARRVSLGSEARAEKASEGAAEKAAEHPGEDRPWVGGTPRVT